MVSAGRHTTKNADDAGVERAFEELRPLMFALAYRITGSRKVSPHSQAAVASE
jgi:DNA-directed RNA polymerase specialized sigma24 family protein